MHFITLTDPDSGLCAVLAETVIAVLPDQIIRNGKVVNVSKVVQSSGYFNVTETTTEILDILAEAVR